MQWTPERGNASFAANVLGARGALLSVLSHFFAHRHWGLLAETTIEGQSLNEEDQLLVLIQSALYLTATRGMGSPEAQTRCERAEPLCRSLNRPDLLYAALISQWGYSLFTDGLTPTMQIAKRVYSLAQELKDPVLLMGGCRALACTLYFLGDIETARQYAMFGVKIWRSGNLLSAVEELNEPVVPCLYFLAMCEWYSGKVASSQANIAEAVTLAKDLNDSHGLAIALVFAGILAHQRGDPDGVERATSELIELSTRPNFANWLSAETVLRGWARAIRGSIAEGISCVEEGIRGYQACGSMINMPYFLALKAEVFHLDHRSFDALGAISEAEAFVERSEERHWWAELHRLRGVFLAATNGDDAPN
jgi:predicted ATPase